MSGNLKRVEIVLLVVLMVALGALARAAWASTGVCYTGWPGGGGQAPRPGVAPGGESAATGNGVFCMDGYSDITLGLPQIPDGSGHLPELVLSYSSGNVTVYGGFGRGWELLGYPRANKISSTEVHVTLHARSKMKFYKDGGGNWIYKQGGASGTAQDVDLELTVPADTGQKIVVKNRQTGEVYQLYNFDGEDHEGMPYRYEDVSGNTVDYTIGGGNGKLIEKVVDNLGREINFTYNDISLCTEIDYGLKERVQFTYDASNRLRKVNMQRDYNGDSTWTNRYHYFWPDTANLVKYYVAPEQYYGLPGDPTEAQVSAASSKKWTYNGTFQATEVWSACSGGEPTQVLAIAMGRTLCTLPSVRPQQAQRPTFFFRREPNWTSSVRQLSARPLL